MASLHKVMSGAAGKAYPPSSNPGNVLWWKWCSRAFARDLFVLGFFFCPTIKHCRELGSWDQKVLALLPPVSLLLLVSPCINNGMAFCLGEEKYCDGLCWWRKEKLREKRVGMELIVNVYFLGSKWLMCGHLGSWLQGLPKFIHSHLAAIAIFFSSWQHKDCSMVGETLRPRAKLKRFGARFWWPTGATTRGSCFMPEAGPEQPGVRSWEPGTAVLFWSAVPWLTSASEEPKHRGKGAGAAKRNAWLYFSNKFNACGNSDGDVHPWETFTIVAGIKIPEMLCWTVWWLGWFALPGYKLAASPGPAGTLIPSPVCFCPAPCTGEHNCPWPHNCSTPPAKCPVLRSCFTHSLLEYRNVQQMFFSTLMA